jgi:hypothetical protein
MKKFAYIVCLPLFLLGNTLVSAAQYQCAVAFERGTDSFDSNCQSPVVVEELTADDALLSVDMTGWQCLRVAAKIREPGGWVMNVGNSYSNNGGGGDDGDFSNDSELEITFDEPLVAESQGQGLLRVFDNDYTAQAVPVLKISDFVEPYRSGVHLEVGDQCVSVATCAHGRHQGTDEQPGATAEGRRFTGVHHNATLQSESVFRLGGSDGEAGANDRLYWIGLNRVVQSGSPRTGTGVQKVFFTLSSDACRSCD